MAVKEDLYALHFVPGKTQEMYERVVLGNPGVLWFVPDQHKNQEMCNKTVEEEADILKLVPYHYKTREMCEKN